VNSTAGLQQRGANSDFFLDLRAAPGSSGGPVIDAGTGEVIGVLVEIILPARVGNIATGVQSARVNELCKPYQNTAAASSKAIEPASDLYGSSAYGSH
jgi:S1-C subfamily serine protease